MRLTQAIARELFDYDPETGVLKYKSRKRKWFKTAGAQALWNQKHGGTTHSGAHLPILMPKEIGHPLGKVNFHPTQLVFFLMTGNWPDRVYWKNKDPSEDNRTIWSNLTLQNPYPMPKPIPALDTRISRVVRSRLMAAAKSIIDDIVTEIERRAA